MSKSGENCRYSKSFVAVYALIFSLILSVMAFGTVIPDKFTEAELSSYTSIANQIARAGMFPENDLEIDAENYLTSMAEDGIDEIKIKSYEYDSYMIQINAPKGKLNYRIDQYTVVGPQIDRSLFFWRGFVVMIIAFFSADFLIKFIFKQFNIGSDFTNSETTTSHEATEQSNAKVLDEKESTSASGCYKVFYEDDD